MEYIHRRAADANKVKKSIMRLGSYTLPNLQKTQQSISRAKLEAGRNLKKIKESVDSFLSEMGRERALINDRMLAKMRDANTQIRRAQKAGDRKREEQEMANIFLVVITAMKRQDAATALLNKCTNSTLEIVSDISVYEKSYRICIEGIRKACMSMSGQSHPFFLSRANLDDKRQFFSDDQLHDMDINKAIEECNRDRSLEMQLAVTQEKDDDGVVIVKKKKELFKAPHSKKDLKMVEKIAQLIREKHKNRISRDEKVKVIQWYNDCRAYLLNNVDVFDNRMAQVRTHLKNFVKLHEGFESDLDKLDDTLKYEHRVVIDQY